MGRLGKLARAASLGLVCVACPAGPKDPPPPEEGTELASAAPRAVGALAGGTDAAPPAVFAPRPPEEAEGLQIPDFELDAGFEPPDASAPATDELPL